MPTDLIAPNSDVLLTDLRDLITSTRERVAATVNAELTMLYWHVGKRIRSEILKDARAEYGKQIVQTVADRLTDEFGKGFNRPNITRAVQFAEQFPDEKICATLSQQLSWSHFKEIFPLKDDLARKFYTELCKLERWSVRTLRERIDSMMYERTALSKNPEDLIARELTELADERKMTPDLVFRDPYLLNFLGLPDEYSGADLEAAILREIETFLLEMGQHFTFPARQKRIVIDGEDFVIDLLLYHRLLRRLVVIELKIGRFKAAYKESDRTIPPLARQARATARRGGAHRSDSLYRGRARTDQTAGTRLGNDPGRGIHDQSSAPRPVTVKDRRSRGAGSGADCRRGEQAMSHA